METYRAAQQWMRCGSTFSLAENTAQIQLDDSIDVCLLALIAVFISLILDGLKVDIDRQVTGLVEKIVDNGGLLDRFKNGFDKIVQEIDSKIAVAENSNHPIQSFGTKLNPIAVDVPRNFPSSQNSYRRQMSHGQLKKDHKTKKKNFDDSKISQNDLEAYHRVKSLLTNITNVLNEKKKIQKAVTLNQADAKSKGIMAATNTSEINPKDKLPITKEDIQDYMRVYSVFNRITGSKHKHLNHVLTANGPRLTPHPTKLKHKPTQSPLKHMPTTIYPIISSTRNANEPSDQSVYSASQQFDPNNFLTAHNFGPIEQKSMKHKNTNSYKYSTTKLLPLRTTPRITHNKGQTSHSATKTVSTIAPTNNKDSGSFIGDFWGGWEDDFGNDFFSQRSSFVQQNNRNEESYGESFLEKDKDPGMHFDFPSEFFKETATFTSSKIRQSSTNPSLITPRQRLPITKQNSLIRYSSPSYKPSTLKPVKVPKASLVTKNPDIYDRLRTRNGVEFGTRKFQITFTKTPIRSSPSLAKYPNTKTRPKITTTVSPWGYTQTVIQRNMYRNPTKQMQNRQKNDFFPNKIGSHNNNHKNTNNNNERTNTESTTTPSSSKLIITEADMVNKMEDFADIGEFFKVQSILDEIQSIELSKQNLPFSTESPQDEISRSTLRMKIKGPTTAKVEEMQSLFLNLNVKPDFEEEKEENIEQVQKEGDSFEFDKIVTDVKNAKNETEVSSLKFHKENIPQNGPQGIYETNNGKSGNEISEFEKPYFDNEMDVDKTSDDIEKTAKQREDHLIKSTNKEVANTTGMI